MKVAVYLKEQKWMYEKCPHTNFQLKKCCKRCIKENL